MRKVFVKIGNVQAFMDGYKQLEQRDAAEASLMLVSGDAGLGKSETALWWRINVMERRAKLVRVKAAYTPRWLLTDIARALDLEPEHTCEKLFGQIVGELTRPDQPQRPIVVDEIEAALHDIKVIETLRDISDVAEIPVIMVGREHVGARLRRQPQIDSRISARVSFQSVTEADIATLARELCEAPIGEDAVGRIARECEGRIRNAIMLLGYAERASKRQARSSVAA